MPETSTEHATKMSKFRYYIDAHYYTDYSEHHQNCFLPISEKNRDDILEKGIDGFVTSYLHSDGTADRHAIPQKSIIYDRVSKKIVNIRDI